MTKVNNKKWKKSKNLHNNTRRVQKKFLSYGLIAKTIIDITETKEKNCQYFSKKRVYCIMKIIVLITINR